MAGGAFNLGDVFVTFIANVEGLVAGLQEVAVTAGEVGTVAAGDMAKVGVAGEEAAAGVKGAGAEAATATGLFSGFGDSLLKTVGPLLLIFGAYEGVKDILKSANDATNQWNNAVVQVNNTLAQNKDIMHITSAEIQKMAEEYSKSTPIAKGVQLQGEAILLTYKSIGQDIFPQVAKILPDVATAFANIQGRAVATSEDVDQAAKKLGVALTNPEQGVNALTRAGIKFTAAQQDEIKAMQEGGDVAGAQKKLLQDFADLTAGKATASLRTYQGAVANAKKQFDDWTGNGIRAAQKALESLGNTLLIVAVWLGQHKVALFAVLGALGAIAVMIFISLVPALIAAAGAFLAMALAAAPWILIGAAIGALAYEIVTHWKVLKQWFEDAWNWFKQNWPLLLAILFGPFGIAVDMIVKYWHQITDFFSALPGNILHALGSLANLLFSAGRDLVDGLIRGVENMAGAAADAVKKVASGIVNAAKSVLKIFSPSAVFADIGENVALGMAGGIEGAANKVHEAANNMVAGTLGGTGLALDSSSSYGSPGLNLTVSLQGAQIIGTVPQDVAEKIGDAIIGKLKRTVRI